VKDKDKTYQVMSDPPHDGEAVFRITGKDVVMGRGGSSQNHNGNVTFRKLVHHNKELYAAAPKHYKLEISKAIVAATRQFGGRFLEPHEGGNSGYFDVGDKRAWTKTSQALREGQVEIKAKLEAEKRTATKSSSGGQNNAASTYKKVIEEKAFFAFSCDFLKSIYGEDGVSISGGAAVQSGAEAVAATLKSQSSVPSSGLQSQGVQEGTADGGGLQAVAAGAEAVAATLKSASSTPFSGLSRGVQDGVAAGGRTHAVVAIRPPFAVKPRASGNNAVSLRHWIQKALQHCIDANNGGVTRSTAVASDTYLGAALKIAKSLTDQIVQGEELYHQHNRTFTELDFLPSAGQDWANYVTITLIDNKDCLQIDSAKIICPQSERMSQDDNNNSADDKKSSSRRMYYLGLVFYELFTGGETPPENLRALALCDSAFVSLSTLALANKKDGDATSTNLENKRHQGVSGEEFGLCKSCCEYMKLVGIANPICDLVFNMLDTVYGDLSGNECYTNMAYVASDLQLMIDKPSIFLRGLDMDKLSLTGLSVNEIVIPREEQFEAVKSCYDLSKSGSCAVAIIKGESGMGKSWLAYHLSSIAISEGGLFLTGKFDQMQEDQAKPFSALASAFDQYCDLLLELNDANMFKLIADNLKAALGPDPRELFKVIPKLEIILGELVENGDDYNANTTDKDWGNALFRLQYLISKFIEVISTHSSVVLFLDDLQWIDDGSVGILKMILRQKPRKFFFLGCCRDNEMAQDHSFWKMITSIGVVGVHATEVKLKPMDEDILNTVVSELLQISPRLTKSLSLVLFSRSKGNALFLLQLLLLLYRENLLYLDFGVQRWAWNEDKIASMKLPDNIAICFTNGICKLSSNIQLALNALSMFGASAKLSYLKLLEDELSMELLKPLNGAAAEGLVTVANGYFHFCHDIIQEASLNLVEEQDRRHQHLAYGKCLVRIASEANDNDLFFTAVHQINLGGPSSITDCNEYFDMASHNAVAGKKSMSMAQFDAALSFFKSGILFLLDGHWQDHYEFSLEIYELACKSGIAAAKISDVSVLSSQILENAKSLEDTIEIRVMNMSMLAYSNPVEALSQGLSIVSDLLGEEIPSPSEDAWERERKITFEMLEGLSDEALLNYKMMSDTKKLTVMKVLEKLGNVVYMVNPPMHPFLIVKRVQITVSYGLSPYAPSAFVALGAALAIPFGDLLTGYKVALLGKALIDKLGVYESKAEVLYVASHIQMYCEPAQSVNDVRIECENAAISAGNIIWACLSRLGYCQDALWLGNNLDTVEELYTKSRSFFEQYDMPIQLFYSLTIHRLIFNLVGREAEALALNGKLTMMKQMFPMPHLMMLFSFYEMYSSFLMNHDNVKECCETFLSLEIKEYYTNFLQSIKVFIAGLVSFQIYRDTGDSSWKSRGVERINEFRVFADQGSDWNFKHKLQLMEAEDYSCSGDYEQAEESYKKAIASARVHKYVNDEALACELAGKFFLNTDDKASSLEYLRLAHEKYCEWGAAGKASQLFDFITKKIGTGTAFAVEHI